METLDYIYEPGVLKVLGRDAPVSRAEIETIVRKREIVYLKLADLSYNQIIDYFMNFRGVLLTKYHIASVMREAGRRARHLNGIYDARVSGRIRIIEIDEVFQGQKNCYLGVVDKESHYFLVFTRLANRSIESFKAVLEPLFDDLDQLELVITDALAAYKSVIPGVFEGVLHVICHVHGYRVFLKEGDKINRVAQKAATELQDKHDDLSEKKQSLIRKKRHLKGLEKRLLRNETKRQAFLSAHGIKKYAKKRKYMAQRKTFNMEANILRGSIRSLKKTLVSIGKKIQVGLAELSALEQDLAAKKQVALQSGRLIARFRRLLDCKPDVFEAELARYNAALDRSRYPVAAKIKKFIKNNPAIYATNLPNAKVSCPPNFINTNTAEGTFSISRPVLNKAKHFFDSEQSEALLEVFRLKFNMSAPYTGPNKHWSPLERAGVNSSFLTWIEALFPLPAAPGWCSSEMTIIRSDREGQPVPSEPDFQENLERYMRLSRNLADQKGKRVKSQHEKIKRR
jgi:hypothetical protein